MDSYNGDQVDLLSPSLEPEYYTESKGGQSQKKYGFKRPMEMQGLKYAVTGKVSLKNYAIRLWHVLPDAGSTIGRVVFIRMFLAGGL